MPPDGTNTFTDALEQLCAHLLRMGGLAEAMVRDARRAFITRDQALAKMVIGNDHELNSLEQAVEDKAVRILASHQITAANLRNIVGTIKLASAIESIGDLAKNIARHSLDISRNDDCLALPSLERIGRDVSIQLQTALDAYSRRDPAAAMRVIKHDHEIDKHYIALLRSMLAYVAEDPQQIDIRSNFIFILKNLERIGDYCTTIAKIVHYIATGTQAVSSTTLPDKQAKTGTDSYETLHHDRRG